MKIAIQTLSPGTNYGGILQAYALQTVLQRMGYEAYVIAKSREPKQHPIKQLLSFANRCVKRYIKGDKTVFLTEKAQWKHDYPIISQHTQPFIDKYINRLPCKTYAGLSKNCVDAIVVGSDQVWRPRYFGQKIIGDAYLAFARDWDIKRIAYAASFGTDEWEYNATQTAECKELISMFNMVSVREDSAIKLCREYYDIEVMHVLDPTMLLDKEDYIELVEKINTPQSLGNLLVYILDETPDKQALVDTITKCYSLTPFRVNSKIENKSAPLEERIQPPLEQWIRGFINADFVITDSFHACVFAIIFNKPFIAYGNASRGASRFHSLLRMFGLEKQFISSAKELDIEKCTIIDWEKVNKKHSDLKRTCIKQLLDSLS